MGESAKITTKTPETKKENAVSQTRKTQRSQPMNSPVDRILHLQRTLGNQAVQRMMKFGVLQTKLRIGQPNDKYEQEADRVADQVMRMPDIQRSPGCVPCGEREEAEPIRTKQISEQITPLVQGQVDEDEEVTPEEEPEEEGEEAQLKPLAGQVTPVLQRQGDEEEKEVEEPEEELEGKEPEEEEEAPFMTKQAGGQTLQVDPGLQVMRMSDPVAQRQSDEGREGEEEPVQAKQASGQTPHVSRGLEAQIQSLKGGGQPLPKSERNFFEPRYNYDFSQVRVHADARAAEIAQALNARAFTCRQDIVFGSGQYLSRAENGKRLLAHELAHVVQQTGRAQTQAKHGGPIEYIQLRQARRTPVTGIAAKVTYQDFVKAAKIVERDWHTLSERDRADKLLAAANEALKGVGVPKLKGVDLEKLKHGSGELDHRNWKMVLWRGYFDSSTITTKKMTELVGIIYHEARHAEQCYRIAQLKASSPHLWSAQKIHKIYGGLDLKIAHQATKNRLGPKGQRLREAEAWSKSLLSKHRKRVHTIWKQKGITYDKAKDKYSRAFKKFESSRSASRQAALRRAQQQMLRAKSKYEKAYRDYRKLAEEKDAWAVADLVEREYRSTRKAPPISYLKLLQIPRRRTPNLRRLIPRQRKR